MRVPVLGLTVLIMLQQALALSCIQEYYEVDTIAPDRFRVAHFSSADLPHMTRVDTISHEGFLTDVKARYDADKVVYHGRFLDFVDTVSTGGRIEGTFLIEVLDVYKGTVSQDTVALRWELDHKWGPLYAMQLGQEFLYFGNSGPADSPAFDELIDDEVCQDPTGLLNRDSLYRMTAFHPLTLTLEQILAAFEGDIPHASLPQCAKADAAVCGRMAVVDSGQRLPVRITLDRDAADNLYATACASAMGCPSLHPMERWTDSLFSAFQLYAWDDSQTLATRSFSSGSPEETAWKHNVWATPPVLDSLQLLDFVNRIDRGCPGTVERSFCDELQAVDWDDWVLADVSLEDGPFRESAHRRRILDRFAVAQPRPPHQQHQYHYLHSGTFYDTTQQTAMYIRKKDLYTLGADSAVTHIEAGAWVGHVNAVREGRTLRHPAPAHLRQDGRLLFRGHTVTGRKSGRRSSRDVEHL